MFINSKLEIILLNKIQNPTRNKMHYINTFRIYKIHHKINLNWTTRFQNSCLVIILKLKIMLLNKTQKMSFYIKKSFKLITHHKINLNCTKCFQTPA